MSDWQKSKDREDTQLFTVKDVEETVTGGDGKSDPGLDRRHSQMMERLEDEKSRQSENRYQMAVDEDYYDSLQWTEQDAVELMARGQAPLVFNKIKPTINWIMGTEKRTRFDYNVLPREANDEKGAQTKKKLLKYVSDVNKLPFHRSEAFKNCVIAGLGWMEEGISADPSDELIFARSENWRNVYQDSRSRELDYSDGRYQIRSKVVDMDMACAMFPDSSSALSSGGITGFEDEEESVWYLGERMVNQRDVDGNGSFNGSAGTLGQRGAYVASGQSDVGRREQVRINEGWYTVPMPVKYFASGQMRGEVFDPKDEYHQFIVKKYAPPIVGGVQNQMRVMLFTSGMPLWDGPSPYRHRKFPLTAMWCYRRARDGMPYGVVRDIRDPQEDLNKRRSKALYILSANRVVMDKGAVDDIEDIRQEAARPDAIIIKNPGKELKFEKPAGEFQGNLEMMQNAENYIQEVSGVTSENLGQSTNATSGKAILARQEQGSVVTANLFDNMRLCIQQQGEKLLALMEQFYTEPKVMRIVGENQPVDWVPINTMDPATGEILNDITASKADFVVDEQDFRASLRQAAQETMTQLMQTLPPEVAISMLDLVVDLWDLPNKEEWLQRIRKVNGQTDPSKKPTPEEIQAQQQMQQEQMMMKQLQVQGIQAENAVKQANAQKLAADAATAMAQLQPQANPELESAQQQLAALTQQLQEAQTNADRLIYESKIKADDRIRELTVKAEQETLVGLSKEREIEARKETEIEKARINADATVEAARIQANQRNEVDALLSKLTDLQKQVADMVTDSNKAIAEHEKAIAKVEQTHEKTVAQLEKAIEKTIEQSEKAIEKVKADVEAKEAKEEAKEPEEKESTPPVINVNVQIDGQGEVTKEIVLSKDKDGNVTGGKVTQKQAKKAK
jgi:hypothetical protein